MQTTLGMLGMLGTLCGTHSWRCASSATARSSCPCWKVCKLRQTGTWSHCGMHKNGNGVKDAVAPPRPSSLPAALTHSIKHELPITPPAAKLPY